MNKEEAMAILGHKHAAILEEVYASAVTEELLNAARRLQRYVYGTDGATDAPASPQPPHPAP